MESLLEIVLYITFQFLILAVYSFFSCCYSIDLYSSIQHGSYCKSVISLFSINLREYFLVFFHWLPLNILVLKFDIFSYWL